MSADPLLPGFPRHQPTITYDGMAWPLETFLDAYGFERADPDDTRRASGYWEFDGVIDAPVWLSAVLADGSFVMCATPDALPWGEVIAFRASEHTPGNLETCSLGKCSSCGGFTSLYEGECDGCWDDDDY